MSLSKAQRFRLGVFIIIGSVVTLFLLVVALKQEGNSGDTVRYYTHFYEESVSGLVEGASVNYRGVRIGTVSGVAISDFDNVKVTLDITESFVGKKDMYTQLSVAGLTGLSNIDIVGGSKISDTIQPGEIFSSKKSLITNISGKVESIVSQIESLVSKVNQFAHPDSLASVKKILLNVESITHKVDIATDSIAPDAQKIVNNVKTTMNDINRITENVRLISDDLQKNVKLEEFNEIMAQVNKTTKSLEKLSETLDVTVQQSREDITISMRNLRETLENTNELSRLLMENPSLLLRGENQKERSF